MIIPGQPSVGTRELDAPEDAVAFDGAFSYPTDGSIVSASSVTTSVTATSGDAGERRRDLAGHVTVSSSRATSSRESVTGEAHTSAGGASASGDTGVTGFTGLVVLGQPVTPTANQQIQLGDWGYAIALEQKSQRLDKPTPGQHNVVTALDVFLTADHGGLPAQSEIQIGYAEANAQASEPAPLPKAPSGPTTTGAQPKEPKSNGIPPILSRPQTVTPKLNPQGYVFPVYGDSSFSDTYGAARGDVSGGWHHGDDIFAPLGAPLLAVAHGTVFSVGWNKVGGWRLWLRDDRGWEYYYAHLSAYTPLAVNGAVVSAGDVLGFVGNTGDAKARRTTCTSRCTRSGCSASATTEQWIRRSTSTRGSTCRTCASTRCAGWTPANARERAEGGRDPVAELGHLDRHGPRPEVVAARDGADGTRRRRRTAAAAIAAARLEAGGRSRRLAAAVAGRRSPP